MLTLFCWQPITLFFSHIRSTTSHHSLANQQHTVPDTDGLETKAPKRPGRGTCICFGKREVLLILDNYIKMIQLYKIHPGLCITNMHIAYEKKTIKKNAMT